MTDMVNRKDVVAVVFLSSRTVSALHTLGAFFNNKARTMLYALKASLNIIWQKKTNNSLQWHPVLVTLNKSVVMFHYLKPRSAWHRWRSFLLLACFYSYPFVLASLFSISKITVSKLTKAEQSQRTVNSANQSWSQANIAELDRLVGVDLGANGPRIIGLTVKQWNQAIGQA